MGSSYVAYTPKSTFLLDEAKQFAITNQGYNATLKKNNAAWKPGYSELQYDVNGHLSGAVDRSGNRSFRYVADAQGQILLRDEIAGNSVNRVHRYYYVDGQRIGDVGNEGPDRTDYAIALAKHDAAMQASNIKGNNDKYIWGSDTVLHCNIFDIRLSPWLDHSA